MHPCKSQLAGHAALLACQVLDALYQLHVGFIGLLLKARPIPSAITLPASVQDDYLANISSAVPSMICVAWMLETGTVEAKTSLDDKGNMSLTQGCLEA